MLYKIDRKPDWNVFLNMVAVWRLPRNKHYGIGIATLLSAGRHCNFRQWRASLKPRRRELLPGADREDVMMTMPFGRATGVSQKRVGNERFQLPHLLVCPRPTKRSARIPGPWTVPPHDPRRERFATACAGTHSSELPSPSTKRGGKLAASWAGSFVALAFLAAAVWWPSAASCLGEGLCASARLGLRRDSPAVAKESADGESDRIKSHSPPFTSCEVGCIFFFVAS